MVKYFQCCNLFYTSKIPQNVMTETCEQPQINQWPYFKPDDLHVDGDVKDNEDDDN